MSSNSLISCFRLLIRPLLRFCLRHNIKIQEIIETCKAEFINAARTNLEQHGEEITTSRISIMTGLQRKDIIRLSSSDEFSAPLSLVSKVLGLWTTSKRYRDAKGEARSLKIEEFYSLVSLVSTDLNPRTVLDELIRIGSAKVTDQNVEIIRSSYIPKSDPHAGFKIAAHDLGDLIDAVDENLLGKDNTTLPHHHLRTEFDRINGSALAEIRKWLLVQGKDFHLRAREYLSQFDQDINPDLSGSDKGYRVSITSFAMSEEAGDKK